jgi:hypothetical protein
MNLVEYGKYWENINLVDEIIGYTTIDEEVHKI